MSEYIILQVILFSASALFVLITEKSFTVAPILKRFTPISPSIFFFSVKRTIKMIFHPLIKSPKLNKMISKLKFIYLNSDDILRTAKLNELLIGLMVELVDFNILIIIAH